MEEDEISELIKFFNDEKEEGNVEGEPCGLGKMWILPKKKTAYTSIPSKDFIIHSERVKILNARGSPHFLEGKMVLMRERVPRADDQTLRIALFLKMMNI